MKVVRMIGSIAAVFLFCVGMCFYSLHGSLKQIVNYQIVDFALEGLVDTILIATIDDISGTESKNIIADLPEDVQQEIETIKSEIINDEELKGIVQAYLNAILDGTVEGSIEMPNLNDDIEKVMQSSIPKIAKIAGLEVSPEEIQALSTQLLQEVNIEDVLNEGIRSIQEEMNSEQKKILTSFHFIQSWKGMFLAIAMMITGILALGLLKKNKYTWLRPIGITSIVGGGVLWVASSIIISLVKESIREASDALSQFINGSIHQFSLIGMQFVILGIIFLFAYFIIKRKLVQVKIAS